MPDEPVEPEGKTFTQEQVNALLAEQKRKSAEKFADYDDLKQKASKLAEVENASKSELQRALDEAAALKAENAKFLAEKQVAQWAAEIVKDSTIPASVLRGSTREELEAHFQELQKLTTQDTAPKPRFPVPVGTPDNGKTGSRAAAALREWNKDRSR